MQLIYVLMELPTTQYFSSPSHHAGYTGAGEGTRTHTLADRNLNPTRLPIPPRPRIEPDLDSDGSPTG